MMNNKVKRYLVEASHARARYVPDSCDETGDRVKSSRDKVPV